MASLANTALDLHLQAGSDNVAEACRVTAFSADRGLNLLPPDQQVTSVLMDNAGALTHKISSDSARSRFMVGPLCGPQSWPSEAVGVRRVTVLLAGQSSITVARGRSCSTR